MNWFCSFAGSFNDLRMVEFCTGWSRYLSARIAEWPKKFPHVNVFGKFCPRVFFGGLGNVGIRLSHFLILPHDPHVTFVWPKWWNFIWNGPCDENKANAQFSPGQCWGSKSRQVKVLNVPLTCPNVGYRIRNKTVNHLNCLQLATKCQNRTC